MNVSGRDRAMRTIPIKPKFRPKSPILPAMVSTAGIRRTGTQDRAREQPTNAVSQCGNAASIRHSSNILSGMIDLP
jgi:hypothetical protein